MYRRLLIERDIWQNEGGFENLPAKSDHIIEGLAEELNVILSRQSHPQTWQRLSTRQKQISEHEMHIRQNFGFQRLIKVHSPAERQR